MTPDIISKLSDEIKKGINSEVQVVYLLAGIRKLLERDNQKDTYSVLNFHCNWVLHSELNNANAQEILEVFENWHLELRTGTKEDDLTDEQKLQLDKIANMRLFKEELF